MAKAKKSATAPPAMQEKFDRITALTDAFAQQYLNSEYLSLITLGSRKLEDRLFRSGWHPVSEAIHDRHQSGQSLG
jgi:hypothetical protein